MSKKDFILNSLRISKDRTLSIKQFEEMQYGVYHKLSSRIADLCREGHRIEYVPSTTGNWIDAKYRLVFDVIQDQENNGQIRMAI